MAPTGVYFYLFFFLSRRFIIILELALTGKYNFVCQCFTYFLPSVWGWIQTLCAYFGTVLSTRISLSFHTHTHSWAHSRLESTMTHTYTSGQGLLLTARVSREKRRDISMRSLLLSWWDFSLLRHGRRENWNHTQKYMVPIHCYRGQRLQTPCRARVAGCG